MLNQWNPQRFRTRADGRRIGSIRVGAIIYIQDGIRPFGVDRYWRAVCREPWIVESWQNREIGAWRVGADGRYQNAIVAGGHLANVRSLRTGRRAAVADWILQACADMGLARSPECDRRSAYAA